jgi:hypothetical protein
MSRVFQVAHHRSTGRFEVEDLAKQILPLTECFPFRQTTSKLTQNAKRFFGLS